MKKLTLTPSKKLEKNRTPIPKQVNNVASVEVIEKFLEKMNFIKNNENIDENMKIYANFPLKSENIIINKRQTEILVANDNTFWISFDKKIKLHEKDYPHKRQTTRTFIQEIEQLYREIADIPPFLEFANKHGFYLSEIYRNHLTFKQLNNIAIGFDYFEDTEHCNYLTSMMCFYHHFRHNIIRYCKNHPEDNKEYAEYAFFTKKYTSYD